MSRISHSFYLPFLPRVFTHGSNDTGVHLALAQSWTGLPHPSLITETNQFKWVNVQTTALSWTKPVPRKQILRSLNPHHEIISSRWTFFMWRCVCTDFLVQQKRPFSLIVSWTDLRPKTSFGKLIILFPSIDIGFACTVWNCPYRW